MKVLQNWKENKIFFLFSFFLKKNIYNKYPQDELSVD